MEELEDPGDHAGRRVLRREQHADDVVGDLLVGQGGRAVAADPGLHQAAQQVGARRLATLPPLPHDVAQHAVQPPPRLQCQTVFTCMSGTIPLALLAVLSLPRRTGAPEGTKRVALL